MDKQQPKKTTEELIPTIRILVAPENRHNRYPSPTRLEENHAEEQKLLNSAEDEKVQATSKILTSESSKTSNEKVKP